MDIYSPSSGEGYEWVAPIASDGFGLVSQLDGRSWRRSWKPPEMEFITEDEGKAFVRADFPWLTSNVLALRATVLEAMGDELERCGELLPLECQGVPLFLLNITTVVNALDEGRSSVTRFSTGERRIYKISKYVFKADLLPRDLFAFRIPEVRRFLVTEKFVDLAKQAGLVGLDFDRVWSTSS